MGKECMARLSRRLWGGTSLKTAAKEAKLLLAEKKQSFPHSGAFFLSGPMFSQVKEMKG